MITSLYKKIENQLYYLSIIKDSMDFFIILYLSIQISGLFLMKTIL